MSKYNFAYVCNYFKALIIPHTPCGFVVAESFRYGLTDRKWQRYRVVPIYFV